MNRYSKRLGFLLGLWLGAASGSFGQDGPVAASCDASSLNAASSGYDVGMFDKTIGRLKPCLPNGFERKDDRVSAYRLLALSYIVTDSLEQARSSVRQLVKADSKYEADPDNDPPLFADMVQDAKPAWYTWFYQGSSAPQWIGRAAIAGAAVSLPFLLQRDKPQPLPEPPGFPNQ